MPKRFQSTTRLWAYRFLALRDGEVCARCHTLPASTYRRKNVSSASTYTLEIDHIDDNPKNNNPDNLRLLCKKCNIAIRNKYSATCGGGGGKVEAPASTYERKNAKKAVSERERREGNPSTRISRELANYQRGSPEMQANFLYELDYRRWILGVIKRQDFISKKDAISAGAEVVGCSTNTSARYLDKLTSSVGPLKETRDMLKEVVITWKDHLEPEDMK